MYQETLEKCIVTEDKIVWMAYRMIFLSEGSIHYGEVNQEKTILGAMVSKYNSMISSAVIL